MNDADCRPGGGWWHCIHDPDPDALCECTCTCVDQRHCPHIADKGEPA